MPLLYERLRAHLLEEIRSGRFGVGDRIPSEMALAEQFNESRNTSKKALETLERDGLIVRFRGKGSFVAEAPQDRHMAQLDHGTGNGEVVPDGPATQSIGYIYPDFYVSFGLHLFHGIEEQAAHYGLQLSIRGSRGHREQETEAITRLVHNGVRGLIVFPVHGEYYNDEILRLLLRGFPVVLVDRYLKGIQVSSIGTNNVEAARTLVTHLTERGRHRIAFLSPPPERTSSIEDRRRGYTIGLRQAGVVVDPSRQLLTLSSTIPGFAPPDGSSQDIQRLNTFLDANPDLDGFIVVEAMLALLLEQVLRSRHQEHLIPSITCFDAMDIPLQPTRFTHILQNERLIGRTAVDTLVAQMTKPAPTTRIDVPFTLVQTTR